MGSVVRGLKNAAWRAVLGQWPPLRDPLKGYTLLLPVPADLPVFVGLALANAAAQDPQGRVETLVVPSPPSAKSIRAYRQADARFARAYEEASARFNVGPVRLVEPRLFARMMPRLSPSVAATNYFIQVHAGIVAATTTHVLLHDADLFIDDVGFMGRHYRRCADEHLACLGVSLAWDNWLREHGCSHVVATWELMLDTRWAREFKPWEHRGQNARINGEEHGFDVTLYTQALTAPERCGLHDASASFEHFSWVIGFYCQFQRAGGVPFEDDRFLLLLIRLLSDALGAPAGDVPAVELLAQGIADGSKPVTYTSDSTSSQYPEFRHKLNRVLAGPVFGAAARREIESAVAPFDRAFA